MEPTPTGTTPVPEAVILPPQSIHKNASWGAILTIVVILGMITIGAFYGWGQRLQTIRDASTGYQIEPTTYTIIATTTAATSTP